MNINYLQYNFPNEILIEIFKYVKYLKSLKITCKRFNDIIIDSFFKFQWFLSYHETILKDEIITLGFISLMKEINKEKKIFDDNDVFLTRIAINLHKSGLQENRKKAFKIFKIIKYYRWIGEYYENGFGVVKINKKKASEYYVKDYELYIK
ncbi:4711_t:CDS:1 [Scutellospora calospora]|uniref:4711_t:CDS:1 n=1 Tax=Scutellospora calospora TaxID=85575 RepID=A0ACA9MQU7_9GLOM|nr:4711_t:CDS:1 [Scutellospora calospora]